MYATKRLSEFKATPEAAWQPPPEGPSSGYLVVNEENTDDRTYSNSFFGIHRGPRVKDLPFPQNTTLTVRYFQGSGQDSTIYIAKVLFVPVINLPLSANRYYAVQVEGQHKGKVHTCSKEEDMVPCCFVPCIQDVDPKPFDHRDIYQQIEIIPHKGMFTAKSVASDGFPPYIFRQQYWIVNENKPEIYQFGEAIGVNQTTRLNYLELNMSTIAITGKWYCPYIFLKGKNILTDKKKRSMFYEVTLEQFWEEVYRGIGNKRILLRGKEIMKEETHESRDGFVWFQKLGDMNREKIGLSLALWERIKWEENREGWDETASEVLEEVKFGDIVLVERFSFKRIDGSVALALDFIHKDKIRTKYKVLHAESNNRGFYICEKNFLSVLSSGGE